ncbi:MAG: hypothetical protein GEU75_15320 [Dehalococcoidia bacterium]|nr:hypothetical protein [Dehalococcoidia bacterium]
MDLYCTTCGEPWDLDTLHEVEGESFDSARNRFVIEGCRLFGASHNRPADTETAEKSAALFMLLGDDVDAVASFMEDFQ